jgi:hypothetical protein
MGLLNRVGAGRRRGVAGVIVIAAVVTAGFLLWRGGSIADLPPSQGPSTAKTVIPTVLASRVTDVASVAEAADSSPTAPGGVLTIPGAGRRNIPLPAGAGVDTHRLVADDGWIVMGLTFAGDPLREPLYAANLDTGAVRKIADSAPLDFTVAGSRAAWAEWTCESSWPSPMPTEQAHPQPQVRCSGWRVVLADLATGESRVVVQGTNPDVVDDAVSQGTPVAVVPAVALAQDTLAYTTGDLALGIQLNLLTLSFGASRALPLEAPVGSMRWAGDDLALIVDSDLHAAGTSPAGYAYPYYLDSELELLPGGATTVRRIASGAYWLAADADRVAWAAGGANIWTAAAPGWRPVRDGYDAISGPYLSDGWLGWGGTWRETPFLIFGPGDTSPRAVPDGLGLTGGWLVLGSEPDEQALPTRLDVVSLSDLK